MSINKRTVSKEVKRTSSQTGTDHLSKSLQLPDFTLTEDLPFPRTIGSPRSPNPRVASPPRSPAADQQLSKRRPPADRQPSAAPLRPDWPGPQAHQAHNPTPAPTGATGAQAPAATTGDDAAEQQGHRTHTTDSSEVLSAHQCERVHVRLPPSSPTPAAADTPARTPHQTGADGSTVCVDRWTAVLRRVAAVLDGEHTA